MTEATTPGKQPNAAAPPAPPAAGSPAPPGAAPAAAAPAPTPAAATAASPSTPTAKQEPKGETKIKIKTRFPYQRACNEKNEKGKLCAGHLKRWYGFSDDIKKQY